MKHILFISRLPLSLLSITRMLSLPSSRLKMKLEGVVYKEYMVWCNAPLSNNVERYKKRYRSLDAIPARSLQKCSVLVLQ